MPKCLNDPKKSYKGTEPSPKGLGYCAGGMKVGEKKKGKDGNMWSVKQVKNGSKRWVKVNVKEKTKEVKVNCKDLVIYEKKVKKWFGLQTEHLRVVGLKGPDDTIYKFISYNKFEENPTKIPNGYKKIRVSPKLRKYYCGTKKLLDKDNELFKKIKHTGYKKYFIHHNYERPYLVYLGKKDAYIYEKPNDKEIDWSAYSKKSDDDNKWMYVKLVKHIKFIKSFVGKSPINNMTKYSGGHGKKFDGNTILLQKNKNTYVLIYIGIEEFKVFNDEIVKFVSPVGNNDVPYPYAIGKNNMYFLGEPYEGYLPKKYFTNLKEEDYFWDETRDYFPFFIPLGKKKSKSKLTLEEFREIQKKKLDDINLQTVKTLAKMYGLPDNGSKKDLANNILKFRGVKIYSD